MGALADSVERPAVRPRTVVITGISGRLGRIVARRLHHELDWQIVGLDRRPMQGRPKDIEHHQVDLRSKKARDVFRAGEVDALIHLGVMHDPRARPAEIYSWFFFFKQKTAYEICSIVRSWGSPSARSRR